MMFLCMLEFAVALRTCVKDSDCLNRSRPDIHSLYCVNHACQKILSPGMHCLKPADCSSYSFFGPLACTEKCKVEGECEYDDPKTLGSMYCCRNIPLGKSCNVHRPRALSGCDTHHSCMLGSKGTYECVPDKSSSWMFSVFLSISGNIGINVGVNLQKRSYRHAYIEILRTRFQTFYVGCIMYVLGKIFGYCSYVFGNQSFIAVLGATGLVSNSIFAPMINDELFTWRDFCAILFVFAGTTLVVMNTTITHKMYSLCELMKMYKRTETLVWFGFILIMIVYLFAFIKYVEINSNWELPGERMMFLKSGSVWFEEDGFVMKYVMALAYVCLSSFIASFTTLSIKSLGEMIDKTISGDNQFVFFTTYFFILVLGVCTFFQIYWLNRALRHYDALLAIPMFHVTWTLLSIITAGIYFREFEQYTASQLKIFACGVGVIFVGSLFLGSRITNKTRIRTKKAALEYEQISKTQ
ncbi:putative magnesium transporter NIPA [Ordospora pajunii]|uniref:putative magnesium transporter NIPA n=1 Tax=Ordospora pajunii TaxID=3039483 RepID=UPI0029526129|nr:putative magnesium transporter NIPA [Ordospora pajunii]KAH9411841.1 putative magnesium transporter NIPA [Ordospora pajunii]